MCFLSILGNSQGNISPTEIIDKSIQYHDPDHRLLKEKTWWEFTGTRPGKEDVKDKILIDLQNEHYELKSFRDNHVLQTIIKQGNILLEVNGSSDFSDEIREKYRLTVDRAHLLKNYYQYLWLMPHKLKDPGTILNNEVQNVEFFGIKTLRLRIDYEPEVGGDRWYFYFDPSSFALVGYQFYHDEAKNDGEYILLEDEYHYENIRIPKKRTWYTNKEDKLLGVDILEKFETKH